MNTPGQPSPIHFFETINAYQKTAALKAAIDLELFTAIGGTPATAAELAAKCGAAPRGIRILSDYLSILGFLEKRNVHYALTLDSATFLDRKSPAYLGGITEFLNSPLLTENFDDLTSAVRKGGTAASKLGTVEPNHPVWVKFARGMTAFSRIPAKGVAEFVQVDGSRAVKVLDIAASHGMFGIAFAQKYPNANIVALDWANVLEVSKENARAAGIADRFSTIAGSAFEVDLGRDYDVVLVPNFLHHFNVADCEAFLKKVFAALRPGGQVVVVEFVPNPDRISPTTAAGFSLVMLGTTPEGDAYTFAELDSMLKNSGFKDSQMRPLPNSPQAAVIGTK
jgi:2-polyprenyl-3-methyl-5-hydroxy-6-metoxy-1,4-benzoquinol methylase